MNDAGSLNAWARVAEQPALWSSMSDDERRRLGETLREAFFALSRKSATVDEALFRGIVAAIDPEPAWTVAGLTISFHPTARLRALRFVDAEKIDAAARSLFARPTPEMPHLAAAFVDPRELSFRTFENIVPLDAFFEGVPLEIALADRKKLGDKPDCFSFSLKVSDATRDALGELDGLGLYVPPLNAVSRGGERFIFHSALLSDALTRAVRDAFPKSLLGKFSHVNPVFRCNRFEPGGDKFHAHFDTPYWDAERKHVSRYTILVYLTGGEGSPALQIANGVELRDIAPMTAVVFDQRHEHEGSAYRDGTKVFLRSELVFEDASVDHDPEIARMFSKACYFTGESVFAPELARAADEYYNRVASAHWRGTRRTATREPWVHKEFRGVHFVANGYDFWFPRGALSPRECAAITLLDYFNASVGGSPFRSLCKTETLTSPGEGVDWIAELLAPFAAAPAEPVLEAIVKDDLFPAPEEMDGTCCPFHCMASWDPTRSDEIVDLYTRAQKFARERILPGPVLVMGEEVFLDPDRFVVEAGMIHVLSGQSLEPVNFAACWNFGGSPPNYIDVAASVGVLRPLVPPILFAQSNGLTHLMFDFFRNSWMVRDGQAAVPVPRIRTLDPGTAEEEGDSPWMDAAETASPRTDLGDDDIDDEPWWGDDESPVVRELFAKPKRKKKQPQM